MKVLRVEPAGELERWLYRCDTCGRETSRLLEPLSSG